MKLLRSLSILSAATGLLLGSAHAAVIGFEGMVPAGTQNHWWNALGSTTTSYEEAGFAVSPTGNMETWFMNPGDSASVNASNDFLYFQNSTSFITITSLASSPFSIASIDLAYAYSSPAAPVYVTGQLSGGGLLSQSFSVGESFSTFTFSSDWTNLSSVVVGRSESFLAVDNIVVNPAASNVPDSGTSLSLVGGALLLLAAISRRTRRTA